MPTPEPFRIRLEDLVSGLGAGPADRDKASADRWTVNAAAIVEDLALSDAEKRSLERRLRLKCDELESMGIAPVDDTELELLRDELLASRTASNFARGRTWVAHAATSVMQSYREVARMFA